MPEGRKPIKRHHARMHRGNLTPCEARLWQVLRGNQLGFHFRSQVTIAGFIVDFCCIRERVVVEVDGGVHENQREADAQRDAILTATGFAVLRFTNDEVTYSLWRVRKTIQLTCAQRATDLANRYR